MPPSNDPMTPRVFGGFSGDPNSTSASLNTQTNTGPFTFGLGSISSLSASSYPSTSAFQFSTTQPPSNTISNNSTPAPKGLKTTTTPKSTPPISASSKKLRTSIEVECHDVVSSSLEKDVSKDKPNRFTQSGILPTFVGEKRKKYEVHIDLLCAESSYFSVMLGTQPKKNEVKDIYWKEDSVAGAEVVIDWIYTKKLPDKPTPTNLPTHFGKIIGAYRIASRTKMIKLKNGLVDEIKAICYNMNAVPGPTSMQKAKSAGSDTDENPLYNFFVKKFVYDFSNGHWSKNESAVLDFAQVLYNELKGPSDTLHDVIRELALVQTKVKLEDPAQLSGCRFHDHSDGGSCSKTG